MINKKNIYKLLVLFFFLCDISIISAQENWKLKKKADGIEIYTSESTKFNSFKGRVILDNSINSFVAFLKDLDEYVNWGYKTKEVSILKRSGDTLQIYHVITQVPFPYKNRDGIYQNKFRWISESNTLFVDIETLDDHIPEDKNFVRVKGNGFWKVVVLSSGKLDITFQMQIDPGGNIPAWLVNMFIDNTPYHTLVNLQKLIKNEKYQNKTFNFIE